jgi:hypothetical protein
MNIKNTVASLGAALILAGAPALASAATTVVAPGPIQLDSVQIEQYYGIFNNLYPGLVTVGFTNQAAQPVTDVVFDLKSSDGQLLRQYDAAGNFQPGASTKQAFTNTEVGANQSLAVDSVTFADGTTWSNGSAFRTRRQSADAASVSAATLFPFVPNGNS